MAAARMAVAAAVAVTVKDLARPFAHRGARGHRATLPEAPHTNTAPPPSPPSPRCSWGPTSAASGSARSSPTTCASRPRRRLLTTRPTSELPRARRQAVSHSVVNPMPPLLPSARCRMQGGAVAQCSCSAVSKSSRGGNSAGRCWARRRSALVWQPGAREDLPPLSLAAMRTNYNVGDHDQVKKEGMGLYKRFLEGLHGVKNRGAGGSWQRPPHSWPRRRHRALSSSIAADLPLKPSTAAVNTASRWEHTCVRSEHAVRTACAAVTSPVAGNGDQQGGPGAAAAMRLGYGWGINRGHHSLRAGPGPSLPAAAKCRRGRSAALDAAAGPAHRRESDRQSIGTASRWTRTCRLHPQVDHVFCGVGHAVAAESYMGPARRASWAGRGHRRLRVQTAGPCEIPPWSHPERCAMPCPPRRSRRCATLRPSR
jgi:hypothetical protein